MKINLQITVFYFCILSIFNASVFAEDTSLDMTKEKAEVIELIKKAANYIKINGKENALIAFRKNEAHIFAIDNTGTFLASPLYLELVETNQINYKDPSGALVVQEEIEKAKSGGGWIQKGRWRKNPETGQYACRKIYISPVTEDYFIGSWYHYPAAKPGVC